MEGANLDLEAALCSVGSSSITLEFTATLECLSSTSTGTFSALEDEASVPRPPFNHAGKRFQIPTFLTNEHNFLSVMTC